MLNTRLYIIQFLGIILLLCGYFLSDQPDCLSAMHFDPASPSVITKTVKSDETVLAMPTSMTQNAGRHKSSTPKHISYEVVLPAKPAYTFRAISQANFTPRLPDNYSYLFYEEINPPPPKSLASCSALFSA